jgi:uncharacterized protein (TIGR00369 family)
MRLDRVEPGAVDVALDLEAHHMNLVGIAHGGLLATVADTATGLAMRSALEPRTTHVTTQLSITFLTPGTGGTVVARGRVLRSGRRFGYAEADVVDGQGTLLARASATFAIRPEAPAQ